MNDSTVRKDLPSKRGVLLQELVEVIHKFADRLGHMHVPCFGPDRVILVQNCYLVFVYAFGVYAVEPVKLLNDHHHLQANKCSHIFTTAFNREEIVRHRLVGKLMDERRHSVHCSIGYDKRSSWSIFLWFLHID